MLDFPMIKTCGVELTVELTSILRAINEYEWIVFTSKNGVIHFYKQLNALNIDEKIKPCQFIKNQQGQNI